jgi:hypothetical protein
MLKAEHEALLSTRSIDAYRQCLVQFTQSLGFRTMDVMAGRDQACGSTEFRHVHNIPCPEWSSLDPSYGRRDPVMQHLKRSSYPVIWGSAHYRDPAISENYEIVAAMGMRSGISLASHLPDGRHFVLCLHVDHDLPRCGSQFAEALSRLEHYAVYAMDAGFRLVMPEELSNVGELTPREIEALRLGFDGWSAPMLAARFNLGERRCQQWLGHIAAKLDSGSFRQAALRAGRIGIFR